MNIARFVDIVTFKPWIFILFSIYRPQTVTVATSCSIYSDSLTPPFSSCLAFFKSSNFLQNLLRSRCFFVNLLSIILSGLYIIVNRFCGLANSLKSRSEFLETFNLSLWLALDSGLFHCLFLFLHTMDIASANTKYVMKVEVDVCCLQVRLVSPSVADNTENKEVNCSEIGFS